MQQAVVKFNLQRVLADPTGEQDRPLVVRRANMRKPASALMAQGQAGLSGIGGPTSNAAATAAAAAAAAGLSSNTVFSSGSNVGQAAAAGVGMGATQLAVMDMMPQDRGDMQAIYRMQQPPQLMALQVSGCGLQQRRNTRGAAGRDSAACPSLLRGHFKQRCIADA